MAFQFPISPSTGQIFNAAPGLQYTWNGTGWAPTGSAAAPVPLFPDGAVNAPGISWLNSPSSGWYRHPPTGEFKFAYEAVDVFNMSLNGIFVPPQVAFRISGTLQVDGRASFADGTLALPGIRWVNDNNTGFCREAEDGITVSRGGLRATVWQTNGLGHMQMVVRGGGHEALSAAGVTAMPILIQPDSAGAIVGLCMTNNAPFSMRMSMPDVGYSISFGSQAGLGPTGMGGQSFLIGHDGNVNARAFNAVPTVMTATAPLTGALANLLDLRGVRYVDGETGRPGIGLELAGIESRFPEVVVESRTPDGFPASREVTRGLNYSVLLAPMVEAIRELAARVSALEPLVARIAALEPRVSALEPLTAQVALLEPLTAQVAALELHASALASRVKAAERMVTDRRRS